MQAYTYRDAETFEGGIVFAKSNIEARRLAASRLHFDEISGINVNRREDLDKYYEAGVPAKVLVSEGWYFGCDGCSMQIDEYNMDDAHLPIDGIVGFERRPIYCCHQCRIDHLTKAAARKAHGQAFLDMMRDFLREDLSGGDVTLDTREASFYVPEQDGPFVVAHAKLYFSFPGMEISSASLEYNHSGAYNRILIGPVRPTYFCAAGDKEAFEKFYADHKAKKAPKELA